MEIADTGGAHYPGDAVDDFLGSFWGESADFFDQAILVNHHHMGASCEACPWKVRFTFLKKNIARKHGMLGFFRKRNDQYRSKTASID